MDDAQSDTSEGLYSHGFLNLLNNVAERLSANSLTEEKAEGEADLQRVFEFILDNPELDFFGATYFLLTKSDCWGKRAVLTTLRKSYLETRDARIFESEREEKIIRDLEEVCLCLLTEPPPTTTQKGIHRDTMIEVLNILQITGTSNPEMMSSLLLNFHIITGGKLSKKALETLSILTPSAAIEYLRLGILYSATNRKDGNYKAELLESLMKIEDPRVSEVLTELYSHQIQTNVISPRKAIDHILRIMKRYPREENRLLVIDYIKRFGISSPAIEALSLVATVEDFELFSSVFHQPNSETKDRFYDSRSLRTLAFITCLNIISEEKRDQFIQEVLDQLQSGELDPFRDSILVVLAQTSHPSVLNFIIENDLNNRFEDRSYVVAALSLYQHPQALAHLMRTFTLGTFHTFNKDYCDERDRQDENPHRKIRYVDDSTFEKMSWVKKEETLAQCLEVIATYPNSEINTWLRKQVLTLIHAFRTNALAERTTVKSGYRIKFILSQGFSEANGVFVIAGFTRALTQAETEQDLDFRLQLLFELYAAVETYSTGSFLAYKIIETIESIDHSILPLDKKLDILERIRDLKPKEDRMNKRLRKDIRRKAEKIINTLRQK